MTRFDSRRRRGDAAIELSDRSSTGETTPLAPTPTDGPGPAGATSNGHAGTPSADGRSAAYDNGHVPPTGEPMFQALSEHEFDVVAVVDAEGRFIFVSSSAERVFGYDVSNAVGQDAFGLFDSLSLEPARGLFADLVTRRRLSVSLEMQTVRADGRIVDLDVVAVNHLADPIGGIVVNIRDITGRKQLEQRIRDEDRRQTTIIDSLADGVMMVDADGTVVRVNESFEVMFEAPRIRVVGRRLEAVLSRGEADGTVLVDGDGEALPVAEHPVLVALRHGRRAVGVVLGILRDGSSAHVGPDQHPAHGRCRRRGHGVPWPPSATSRRPGRPPPSSGGRSSSSRCSWTRSRRASWPATPRAASPSSIRPPGGSTDCPRSPIPSGPSPPTRDCWRADGSPMDQRDDPLLRAMSGEQLRDVEIVLASEAGDHRKVSVNGQALVDDDGWMLGAVVAMHDVTEQKRNEERLAELALHDPLTGLANRILLAERLQQAIDGLARSVQAASAAGDAVTGSRAWPSSSWTSTSSRRSTTDSATTSGTTC